MENLTPQEPAEGILKQNDYGDSKWYKVECNCHNTEHEATVEVEADDHDITVHLYMTTQTTWWKDHCSRHFDWLPYDFKYYINRIINSVSFIYTGVVKGYVEHHAFISLTQQSALNFSSVLVKSMGDVEKFRAERTAKWEAEKAKKAN